MSVAWKDIEEVRGQEDDLNRQQEAREKQAAEEAGGSKGNTEAREGTAAAELEVARSVAAEAHVHDYIRSAPVVSPRQTCREVIEQFAQAPDCECVVVCDESRRPLGLVMKSRLTRIQTQRFGQELFYGRSITMLMESDPLKADKRVSAQELIERALGRDESTLYDCVVITDGDGFEGVVTMADLLNISRLLQRQSAEVQMRTIRGAEQMVGEIDRAASEVLGAARQGKSVSELLVDLALRGKTELDNVSSAFGSLSLNASRQAGQIGELDGRAGAIGEVTKLIRELADQCNLLAVNATIEAARAGEHGKGFGVVADEIRRLAEQTKKSADQISLMLRGITESVKHTVELAEIGRAETDNGRLRVHAALDVFEQMFHAAAGNLESARAIGGLSEQACRRSEQVLEEMKRLAAEIQSGK